MTNSDYDNRKTSDGKRGESSRLPLKTNAKIRRNNEESLRNGLLL